MNVSICLLSISIIMLNISILKLHKRVCNLEDDFNSYIFRLFIKEVVEETESDK